MSDDDDFRGHEDMRVPLPLQNETNVLVPQLFIKRLTYPIGYKKKNGKFERDNKGKKIIEYKYGYTISKMTGDKSINKTRQISSRHNMPVFQLYTSKVDQIQTEPEHDGHYIPRLADFPILEDRRRIFEYLTHLNPDETKYYPQNKTRGRPPILFKNWDYHDYGDLPPHYKQNKKVSHEDIFGSDSESDNDKKGGAGGGPVKKKGRPKKIIPISQLESESESDEEKPPSPKPKPKKKAKQPIPVQFESDSEEEEKKKEPEKPKPKSRGRQKKSEPVKEVEREESIASKVFPPRHYPEIENVYKDFKLTKSIEIDNIGLNRSKNVGDNYIGKPNEKTIVKYKTPKPYYSVNQFHLRIRKLPNQQLWGLTMVYTPDYHTEVLATIGYYPNEKEAKEVKTQLEQRFKKEKELEKIGGVVKDKGRDIIKKAEEKEEAKKQGGAGGGGPKGSGVDPCWEGYEMVGMKKKKGKKVPNCVPKGGELPDFENIKWNTFKALYNRFLKKNPEFKDKIEDLQHFAHFVISNPDKFSKIAEKKALFYQNILKHKNN